MARAYSHVGLSTLDVDTTRAFYEDVLGLRAVRCDVLEVEEGRRIRHVFFDAGDGQLIAFMEPRGIAGIPAEYDAGINRGPGVPDAFYHFAFEVESVKDPNGLMLELTEDDRVMQVRERVSLRQRPATNDFRDR
jgi:catechol 2,3-dioxygenase-like lactoylglutathione lyase family enzyme